MSRIGIASAPARQRLPGGRNIPLIGMPNPVVDTREARQASQGGQVVLGLLGLATNVVDTVTKSNEDEFQAEQLAAQVPIAATRAETTLQELKNQEAEHEHTLKRLQKQEDKDLYNELIPLELQGAMAKLNELGPEEANAFLNRHPLAHPANQAFISKEIGRSLANDKAADFLTQMAHLVSQGFEPHELKPTVLVGLMLEQYEGRLNPIAEGAFKTQLLQQAKAYLVQQTDRALDLETVEQAERAEASMGTSMQLSLDGSLPIEGDSGMVAQMHEAMQLQPNPPKTKQAFTDRFMSRVTAFVRSRRQLVPAESMRLWLTEMANLTEAPLSNTIRESPIFSDVDLWSRQEAVAVENQELSAYTKRINGLKSNYDVDGIENEIKNASSYLSGQRLDEALDAGVLAGEHVLELRAEDVAISRIIAGIEPVGRRSFSDAALTRRFTAGMNSPSGVAGTIAEWSKEGLPIPRIGRERLAEMARPGPNMDAEALLDVLRTMNKTDRGMILGSKEFLDVPNMAIIAGLGARLTDGVDPSRPIHAHVAERMRNGIPEALNEVPLDEEGREDISLNATTTPQNIRNLEPERVQRFRETLALGFGKRQDLNAVTRSLPQDVEQRGIDMFTLAWADIRALPDGGMLPLPEVSRRAMSAAVGRLRAEWAIVDIPGHGLNWYPSDLTETGWNDIGSEHSPNSGTRRILGQDIEDQEDLYRENGRNWTFRPGLTLEANGRRFLVVASEDAPADAVPANKIMAFAEWNPSESRHVEGGKGAWTIVGNEVDNETKEFSDPLFGELLQRAGGSDPNPVVSPLVGKQHTKFLPRTVQEFDASAPEGEKLAPLIHDEALRLFRLEHRRDPIALPMEADTFDDISDPVVFDYLEDLWDMESRMEAISRGLGYE